MLKKMMVIGLGVAAFVGCKDKPGYYPNRDEYLRKPVSMIRADGSKRIYPSEAPRGRDLVARSQVGYMAKTVDVANLSSEDWGEFEIWVNGQYVVDVPGLKAGELTSVPWDALYDREGKHPPRDSRTFLVSTVEVYKDGKLYDVRVMIPPN